MTMSTGIHVNEPTNVTFKMLPGNTNIIAIEQKGEHGATPWDIAIFLPNDPGELENFLEQLGGAAAQARRELIPDSVKKFKTIAD